MSISMIGIDHSMAPVDIRALFAFTRKNAGEAMEKLKEQRGIDGCIILSTCNRLEVWASVDDEAELSLYKELCKLKNINDDQYEIYFTKREGHAAVEHLFYLASGLKSQILGEDQILTQVKDALGIAREHFTTDGALEVLFRMAVTAGKKIKTEVPFSHGNPSVIHQAIEMLDRQGYCVQDKVCMVIGNGEMGKVAAQALMEAGADVTVTVRQYRSGMVNIPFGCKRINYGERMDYLPKCDLVVSATASPNFTLREELFENLELEKETIDLFEMSKEIIETLQPAAKKRHISISYQGKRLSISGMPQIIYEMLYNVCDNAIHYNKDEGTVVITTEKTEEGICWSVADTGIGIPLAEQERIFERFYRVDKSHSRATGGTGLGLSIVADTVRRRGGSIAVSARAGGGTCFTVRLPAVRREGET